MSDDDLKDVKENQYWNMLFPAIKGYTSNLVSQ